MEIVITREMLAHYIELNRKKKEIEEELEQLKKAFNLYFDEHVGENVKGEFLVKEYKLQRQIRKIEKFDQEATVNRLEELSLSELLKKIPDEKKINSAIELGILKEEELKECKRINTSQAIYVKQIG